MLRNDDATFDAGAWLAVAMMIAVLGIAACQGNRPSGEGLDRIGAALPDSVFGWTGEDQGTVYDTESIYSYIDGHAEVYLAYGMTRCLARRYAGPDGEGDISVDVFEMSTPADAFGVFTHDRDGDPVAVGVDGLYRYGWLSFWKGPFFVSIYAEEETEASRAAVLELGRTVGSAIPAAGEHPVIVGALPTNGLDPSSVRYLHSHQILNSHVWLSDGDVFGLSADTPAALGRYRRDGASAYLLVVEYPDVRHVAEAMRSFEAAFPGESDGVASARQGEDGWYAMASDGRRMFAVLAAESRDAAETLLSDALEGGEHDG